MRAKFGEHTMPKLIPFEKVQELVGGMSQPTIWRMRRNGTFPQPVAISPNRIAWREADVVAWVETRTATAPQPIAA
jgi:prophage regulatory protein